MSHDIKLVNAVQDLLCLRRQRLGTLPSPPAELEYEIADIELQLRQIEVTEPMERRAIEKAFAELVEIFGSAEMVWPQYPTAAGLLHALRTPIARQVVLSRASTIQRPTYEADDGPLTQEQHERIQAASAESGPWKTVKDLFRDRGDEE